MVAAGKVEVKRKNDYLIDSFEFFLKENSRGKKTFLIYQRLFSQYLKVKNIPKAEDVLVRFRDSFPRSRSKHEVMIANLIDYFRKLNDKDSIIRWAQKIKNKDFLP